MNKNNLLLVISTLLVFSLNSVLAGESAPWGLATVSQPEYKNQKVVYDLTADNEKQLAKILSRIGLLSDLNGNDMFDSSIVVVIHGDAIPFFSTANTERYRHLMGIAHGQTLGEVIEFRMCQASANNKGLKSKDIHGFVTLIPMADAEIVRLQQKGYFYMR